METLAYVTVSLSVHCICVQPVAEAMGSVCLALRSNWSVYIGSLKAV